uniref:Transmembrane protein n=1 Tax=Cajanus cajan TaxID=3821 RepID=A0A151S8T1_CAJCA|nr:hypothetical protein KK1_026976 [Cajanus cajan]
MAFSYKNTLFTVVLIIFTILVVSPQFGAACRPLSSQGSKQNGPLLWSILRGPAPPSNPDPIH